MSQTYSSSLGSPVIEAGLVRFKFGVSAEIQAGSATPNPILQTLSAQIEETLPGFSSTQTIADLIAQPTSTRFAGLLFNYGLHRHLAVNDWLTLQITADQDFCFFTISADITAALNSAQDMQATRVGSQTVTRSTNVSVSFGPSRAAWLGMGLRLGPQFTAFTARMMPSIAPTASAGATGAATQSMFSTWVGPIGWAIPIAILVRDFVVIICDCARQQGVRRGEYNQVGMAYVRHAYGMRPLAHASSPDAVSAGQYRAQEDIRRYGAASVRRYLEQHYRQGRAMPTAHSQAGGFDFHAVDRVGDLLGEALYAQGN